MNTLPPEKNRRVLVIDDNRAIHDDFRKILSPAIAWGGTALDATEAAVFGGSVDTARPTAFEVDSAYQGQEGVMLAAKALEAGRPYALAFVDVRMPPGWDGVVTTRKLWELDPDLQVVLCTAYSDYSWGQMFEQLGQRDGLLILKKPFDGVEAFQLAHALTEKWWLHQQSRRKMEELESRVAERTSELQQTNRALQTEVGERERAQSFLNSVVENLPLAVFIKEARELRFVLWNKAGEQLTGIPNAEMIGRNDHDFFPKKDAELYTASDRAALAGRRVVEMPEEVIQSRHHGARITHVWKVPIFDSQGSPAFLLGISEDITGRKRAEAALKESESRYHSLFESMLEGYAYCETVFEQGQLCDFIYLEVNGAFEKLTGLKNVVGKRVSEVIPGIRESNRELFAIYSRVALTGQPEKCETYLQVLGLWLSVGVYSRDPGHFVAVFDNITERKHAEAALLESKRFLRSTLDALSSHIAILDESGTIIEVNAAWNRFAAQNDFRGKHCGVGNNYLQLCDAASGKSSEEAPLVAGGIRAIIAGPNDEFHLEYPCHRPREQRWFIVRVTRFAGHGPVRIVVAHENITARKQAEARLLRTEELYRRAIAGAGAVPYALDFETRSYVFMGEGIEQLIGYAPQEMTGQVWKAIIQESVMTGDTTGLTKDEAARRMAGGEIRKWQCDMRVRTRDGKSRWLSDASVQNMDQAGRPTGAMGILQDITERKQTEIFTAAFSKLAQRLSALTSAPEAFGVIQEVSRELFGWDAFCLRLYSAKSDSIYSGFTVDTIDGQLVAETQSAPEKPGELYRRIMERGAELILRDQPPAFGADMVPFGDVSRPSSVLMFVPIRSGGHAVGLLSVQSYTPQAYHQQDLQRLQTMADQCGGAFERIWADEALHKSEAQLFQSQKLEVVGKLAGGIAHEFNSILTAILGQSELLLNDLPTGSPLVKNATEISKAAGRAATLTRQLLAYGRKQFLQPETLDLNQIIAGMEGMFRHLLGADVDTRIIRAADLQAVKADAGQIDQVIMNLVINARDAMPHGGKLTLETANVSFGEETAGRYPELHPGEYVMLAITDTGTGMSAEVKARAFEPFFSTKGVGQGTGLGLSTSYGIIKQSGGHISVYSEPGQGTTFKIYLPQVPAPAPIPLQRLDTPELPRGTETILLVEDDPALRDMAATLLRRLGYKVLAAANGLEALNLKQPHATRPVDLLFTDVVMPHMSGKELAERVQASSPHTRILFASAYTGNAMVHQGVLNQGMALLQKPFTPSALARTVREVLDQPRAQRTFRFETPAPPSTPTGS